VVRESVKREGAHVAIIGGGWAGMAAAVELAAQDVRVTVFEAAKTLGGRARRVEIDGLALDNGLHILLGAYGETLRLIDKVRMPGQPLGLRRLPLRLRVEPDFDLQTRRLPAPFHLAVGLLWAKGLTLSEKVAAVGFMLHQQRRLFQCDPALTVEQLLIQSRQSSSLLATLWAPLCVAALNTRPADASAQVFLNVLRDSLAGARAASDLLLPTIDFSALFPDRARGFVEARGGKVHCGASVRGIRPENQGFTIDSANGFTHAIVAVDPQRLEAVVGDIATLEPVIAKVRRLDYRPIHSIYLQYPQHVILPVPMIGLTNGLAHWAFDRGALAGQHGLIGVVISGDGPHQTLAHDELAARIHRELADRWPLPAPRWQRVIAEKRATFACVPGVVRPTNVTPVPGLLLAGDYTASAYPATLETAVRSGVAAAGLVLKDSRAT
jgi:hydroxysqualene dehydroxylase